MKELQINKHLTDKDIFKKKKKPDKKDVKKTEQPKK